ncbi:MAG: hypothetical protein M3033_14355 [Acidobacteriota bacterium]|nr:hypothetical protein [Acidobacteriota bacterium]
MKYVFTLFLFLISAANFQAQEAAGGHFLFSGSLNQLTAEGVKVAPVSSGLPFSMVLTEAGARIAPAQFDLKIPGASDSLKLSFENLKFAGGHLTAMAKITNSRGAVLEGVRLDVVSAKEEFQTKDAKGNLTKDAQGNPVLSTRTQTVNLASPLFFGDLAKNDSSDSLAFDAATIKFAPETTKINVNGVVSGLRYLGAFNVKDLDDPGELATDAQGRIYICDVGNSRIVRTNADGGNIETVAKLEDQCQGVGVDPKTGDIYATNINYKTVRHFSDAGADKGSFESDSSLYYLRFDRNGSFYGAGSHVFRFNNQKPALDVGEIAGDDLYTKGFDIDAGGNIWIVSGLDKDRHLYRVGAGGKNGQRIASGADWRLGRVDVPQSVRIDAGGNAYVVELGEENLEASRISVFDKNGAFVRVFGRGGRTPKTDTLLPGQVYRPVDIAFGTDERVYIACENDGGFSRNLILMFQPF